MHRLTRPAPAKINLTLRVCGRRPGGFHDIESLTAKLEFADELEVAARCDGELTLECDDPAVPSDERNLALRAAVALREATGCRAGAHIRLRKRIPPGSGLGGGSSDAAATLMLLNELWQCGLDTARLAQIGATVGSDVPLFFSTPLCVIRGRGDQVQALRQRLRADVLLLLPRMHLATAAVYKAWDRLGPTADRPGLDDVLKCVSDLEQLDSVLFNDLEEAAGVVRPEFALLLSGLRRVCGRRVHMTGSGAALFCLERLGTSELKRIALTVNSLYPQVKTVLTRLIS